VSHPTPIAVSLKEPAPSGASDLLGLACQLVNDKAVELDAPPATVAVVFTDDFADAVERVLAGIERGSGRFDTVRVGGMTVAKTIAINASGSESEIIFDVTAWPTEGDGLDEARSHRLLTHELFHVVLWRLQHASGYTDDVRRLAFGTPRPVIQAGIRKALEELRCDLFANAFYMQVVQLPSGETTPIVNLIRPGYVEAFEQDGLNAISEHWPRLVSEARARHADPADPALALVSRIDPMLILMAHAEAEACWLGYDGLLGISEIAGHPAMSSIIGPTWAAVTDAIKVDPLPALCDFADAERRIVETGFDAVTEMFDRLGLYFRERVEGRVELAYL
jgi:hypothetical protein